MGRALIVQARRDAQPVDGMAPGEMFGHQTAFVRLERPDKVPFRRQGVAQRRDLIHPFLDVVLAEGALSRRQRFCDIARRFGFTDGKQRNFLRIAAATRRRRRDALTNLL